MLAASREKQTKRRPLRRPVLLGACAIALGLTGSGLSPVHAVVQPSDKAARPDKGGKKAENRPLEITRNEELRFGRMVVTANTGRVVVPAQGLVAYQNAVKVSGQVGPARLTFTGEPNRMIEVLVVAPILSRLIPDGRVELESLDVEPLTRQGVSKYPGAIRMRLDSSGTVGLLIGGTLRLQPNSSAGIASIPIPVTANYINE